MLWVRGTQSQRTANLKSLTNIPQKKLGKQICLETVDGRAGTMSQVTVTEDLSILASLKLQILHSLLTSAWYSCLINQRLALWLLNKHESACDRNLLADGCARKTSAIGHRLKTQEFSSEKILKLTFSSISYENIITSSILSLLFSRWNKTAAFPCGQSGMVH